MSAWSIVVVVLFPALVGTGLVASWWLVMRSLSHDYGNREDWWCPSCRKFHPRWMAHCPRKEP